LDKFCSLPQAEMQEKQLHMMIKTQERMKRMQVAQMLAVSRYAQSTVPNFEPGQHRHSNPAFLRLSERFYWLGSVYGLLLAGATAFAARNKHVRS
jgi:hypothetical protein